MERHCKNCNDLIYVGKSHCANCGCKWIENRITMKQVAHDFGDMYLGIDTKFVRTFLDLFRRPEAVILGYMGGRRVYYMDAVRYLLLALFVTGIYTFTLKQTGILDEIMASQFEATVEAYRQMGMSEDQIEKSAGFAQELGSQAFELQGFLLLLTIPLLAFTARLTFYGKRYFNFTEQIVFYLYTYGHSIIVTTPFTLIVVFFFPAWFTYISFITFPLMYLYNMYCYKRCFKISNAAIIKKTVLSIVILIGLSIATGIVLVILGIIAGLLIKSIGII
jgi:hypothetical protein